MSRRRKASLDLRGMDFYRAEWDGAVLWLTFRCGAMRRTVAIHRSNLAQAIRDARGRAQYAAKLAQGNERALAGEES